MIKISDLKINSYEINIDILDQQKVGFFAKDKKLINSLLLMIAGITKTKNNITINDQNVYDNYSYFRNRIYMDCSKNYFQTIKAEDIESGIRYKYHKNIDITKLKTHFTKLRIRGECEINRGYIITKCGSNLINLSVLISSNDDLIINDPTININRESDINYFQTELSKYRHMIVMGLDSLKKIAVVLDKLYLLTDNFEVLDVNIKNDIFYALEKTELVNHIYDFDKYIITKQLSKDELKLCDKNKIKYKKITVLDIEKYMVNNDV